MQVLNLCIGRPYKVKDNMGNEIDKKAWTRIGTMFIRTDEKTGEPRYSMLFDAYPAHGENIAAFPKENRDNQEQYQPKQNTETMTQELNNQREDEATMPTDKELSNSNEEEVKIEDVPF